MDLRELFTRLFDEQKWREQQAQKLSSGLGSLPYSFTEQMNMRAPGLMNAYDKADQKDAERGRVLDSLANNLGPKPQWFEDRYQLQQMFERFKQDSAKRYQNPGI